MNMATLAGTSWAALFLVYTAAAVLTRLLSVGIGTFWEQTRVSMWLGLVEFATRVTIKQKGMLVYAITVSTDESPQSRVLLNMYYLMQHCKRPPSPFLFTPRHLRLWA